MPGKAEEKCFNFVYVVKLLRYSSNLVLGQFVNQLKHIIRLEWRKKVHKTTIFCLSQTLDALIRNDNLDIVTGNFYLKQLTNQSMRNG